MTIKDIEQTICAFQEAGGQAKELGFNCVEIHGAHGYLIGQFFWDQTNQRNDAFGEKLLAQKTASQLKLSKLFDKRLDLRWR